VITLDGQRRFRIFLNELSRGLFLQGKGTKMEKLTEQRLAALLAEAGVEPEEGDLARFSKIIDGYVTALKTLYSVDLGDEEIAPVFHPESPVK
jgi:hypothetical protein